VEEIDIIHSFNSL